MLQPSTPCKYIKVTIEIHKKFLLCIQFNTLNLQLATLVRLTRTHLHDKIYLVEVYSILKIFSK